MVPEVKQKFVEFLTEQKPRRVESALAYLREVDRLELIAGDLTKIKDYGTLAGAILKIKRANTHSETTTAKIASMVKVYLDFCGLHGYGESPHPFQLGHGFEKGKQKEPEFFDCKDTRDKEIIQKVLCYPNLSLIHRAMIWTLYAAGVRRKELCGLNCEDLDLDARFLHVRKVIAKREHWRYAAFDEKTAMWLGLHLEALQAQWGARIRLGQFPLFPTADGRRMQPGSVWKLLARLQKRLGLSTKINPHKWRHTLAPRLLLGGMDVTQVARQMGHESLHTTMLYTRYKPASMRLSYDRAVGESSREEDADKIPA